MSRTPDQLWQKAKELFCIEHPLAIAMWDFSWLERRWPGAGYEDWDKALDGLTLRGYNAVRIEAYPHLIAADMDKTWTLLPVWNTQAWGAPSVTRIHLQDDLRLFLQACRRHGVRVALSTWFRQDEDRTLMKIKTPREHAETWIKTLNHIRDWGELDNLLYVDLCNEFPLPVWAPFFSQEEMSRGDPRAVAWMREAVEAFKAAYPQVPVTFSFAPPAYDETMDVRFLDFLEPHLWMANNSDYYEKVGYAYEKFSDAGYTNMALRGKDVYFSEKQRFDACLTEGIDLLARWALSQGKPLITTECWAVVDYKDGPLLSWDWVLELNRLGVEKALQTGCWAAMSTSNFCGPQFVGMWRETGWHRELTDKIKNSR